MKKLVTIVFITFIFLSLLFPTRVYSLDKKELMVDVGGYKLHCRVFGKGTPAIVLISGANVLQTYWDMVIPTLSAKTTIVTYDRAGYGKSGIGNHVYHGVQQAEELKVMLDKIDIQGPYILVGHSFGGYFARLFSSKYPQSMAGLILEDTTSENVTEYRRRRLKGEDLKFFKKMEDGPLPENVRPEIKARKITEKQVREISQMPRIPFLIISGGKQLNRRRFSQESNRIMQEIKIELHKKCLELIPDGKHIIVEGVYHTIHSEKPQTFIESVFELLEKARK